MPMITVPARLKRYRPWQKTWSIEAPTADIRALTRENEWYGPIIPKTLEEVAKEAREDPLPLRGPKGGYYGAELNPAVLARQFRQFQSAFSSAEPSKLPPWAIKTGLAVVTLALAGIGYWLGPVVMGVQGGVVQGARGALDSFAPLLGAAAGLALGGGMTWWLLLKQQVTRSAEGDGDVFDIVYAHTRVTQVEFIDRLGNPVPSGTPGARRRPVRRLRTYMKRADFADRQEVFVPPEDEDRRNRLKSGSQERFRKGDIRLETTRELRTVRTPHDLHDGEPLTGRWRGVNVLRWFVALKYPLETGLVHLQYHMGEDLKAALRKFFVSTYGWWVLLLCAAVGTLLLFMVQDFRQSQAEGQVPDRTPVERRIDPEVTP